MIEDSNSTLVDCLRDPSQVAAISRETAKALWLQVNNLGAHLMTRWASQNDSVTEETVLTVKDAAVYARVSQSFLYDNWKRLPCAFRAGRGLRFHKGDLLADIASMNERPGTYTEPITNRRKPPPSARIAGPKDRRQIVKSAG